MRHSVTLLALLTLLFLVYGGLALKVKSIRDDQEKTFLHMQSVVSLLGLTDLALSTEARYTRHPAVSDSLVIVMDHPGALDHFPSTMFWAPVR